MFAITNFHQNNAPEGVERAIKVSLRLTSSGKSMDLLSVPNARLWRVMGEEWEALSPCPQARNHFSDLYIDG